MIKIVINNRRLAILTISKDENWLISSKTSAAYIYYNGFNSLVLSSKFPKNIAKNNKIINLSVYIAIYLYFFSKEYNRITRELLILTINATNMKLSSEISLYVKVKRVFSEWLMSVVIKVNRALVKAKSDVLL